MKIQLILGLLLSFSAGAQTFTVDERPILEKEFANFQYPRDLDQTNLRGVRTSPENPFEWAGRLKVGHPTHLRDCSAGVVRLAGSKLTDKALVLTAAHCLSLGPDYGHMAARQVFLDRELDRNSEIVRFSFERPRKIRDTNGILQSVREVQIARVIFAAFDVLDLALLEMDYTYAQLTQPEGQQFPIVQGHEFQSEQEIRMFGLPSDATYITTHFHQSTCASQGTLWTRVSYSNVEGDQEYVIRNRVLTTCSLYGGMSGGYARNSQGEVIGVAAGGYQFGYSFYADVSPLTDCAMPQGQFDRMCLQKLKFKIETENNLEERR